MLRVWIIIIKYAITLYSVNVSKIDSKRKREEKSLSMIEFFMVSK